jgi:chemotaxis protein CheX
MTESFENGAVDLTLPPILDLVAAANLLGAFHDRRGHALQVNGAGVQRLGAQCLQVLLAARAAWAADDQPLRIENFSEEFSAALELMGVTPQALTYSKELAS